MAEGSTTQLQVCINRLNAGDPAARDQLIERACERLRRLTQKMLRDYGRVRRWEDTDDVLQNAVVRLLRALQAVPVASVQEFFRLAAVEIRRELIDLARHYYGPEGPAAKHATKAGADSSESTPQPPEDRPESTDEPARLAQWSEFHQHVEALPAQEREVFSLLWYHGMTQPEAAAVLNVSLPSVKRWWLSARLRLQAALRGQS